MGMIFEGMHPHPHTRPLSTASPLPFLFSAEKSAPHEGSPSPTYRGLARLIFSCSAFYGPLHLLFQIRVNCFGCFFFTWNVLRYSDWSARPGCKRPPDGCINLFVLGLIVEVIVYRDASSFTMHHSFDSFFAICLRTVIKEI